MYFGTVKGLIRFDPQKLPEDEIDAPIYITGIQVNNRELAIGQERYELKNSISFTDSLILPHNQSTVSIDFAVLSFLSTKGNEYAYKLEGLDQAWTHLSTNRKVYFTNLPAGDYQFRVSLTNAFGERIGHERRLQIKILPAPWASNAAFLLYALLISALILYLAWTYHQRQKAKHQLRLEQLAHRKEEEMYQSKMAFFTQVAHEIRTPLTLIRAPLERVMKKAVDMPGIQKNLQIMQRNTERLLELAGQLLDFRKAETQGLQLNYQELNLISFTRELVARYQPTAADQDLKLSLQLPDESLVARVDLDGLDKMLNNLLSNAIKYAESEIAIELAAEKGQFFYRIENDGELISPELRYRIFEPFVRTKNTQTIPGAGLGLAVVKSLAEMHGGSIRLKIDSFRKFNIFVLTLPINQPDKN